MRFIGITGGVGAGKSEILHYIEKNYPAEVVLADELAHTLMQPGTDCFAEIAEVFGGEDIFAEDGSLDKKKMAEVIFSDEEKREQMNAIVHPAVKREVLRLAEQKRKEGKISYFILEAALLIEEGYDKICDELWYIYTTRKNRRERLKASRGYSDEKIDAIFHSQLSEETYREYCKVMIDNNGTREDTFHQLDEIFSEETGQKKTSKTLMGEKGMEKMQTGEELVFGLDIGTRNVVGTVGYRIGKEFIVLAQYSTEHETRAMLDGQIHDIGRVGNTIRLVKEALEEQIGKKLTSVCIAAAGRVLKTVTTNIEYEFETESVVLAEDVHTLDLLGIEKAQAILKEKNDTNYKFYCVGYSVVKYYLNGEIFSNLIGHKAEKISEDIIVTFLPEDVVDGLYAAVGIAGLTVANLTLEPIAAIDIAIPENYRMLNIALVDVGAGTSDISVTKDGSIIAYGMIPLAGDEITELIVQKYLVDFQMAEHIKLASTVEEEIEYTDIMMLKHTIKAEEVWELTENIVDRITTDVADKIKELNGDQTVSATFIVGGGGKIHGFETMLAEKLELPYERVALRGEEVLQEVTFEQPEIKKDPLLVTPIGICLNYFDQKNSFIMVHFNGERIKLYDNNKLTIVDAAMQAGFPNEYLFPKRGKEINFTVNGSPRIARGEAGESAIVKVNDKITNINAPLIANSYITVEPSTAGEAAKVTIADITDYTQGTVNFIVNGKNIHCPKFVEVNGSIEMSSYEIKEGDAVETRNFYTIGQLAEFMDVEIDTDHEILVNNRPADLNTLVYENFTVEWVADARETDELTEAEDTSVEEGSQQEIDMLKEQAATGAENSSQADGSSQQTAGVQTDVSQENNKIAEGQTDPKTAQDAIEKPEEQAAEDTKADTTENAGIWVIVNGERVILTGKAEYIFVDIFNVIDFDLTVSKGRSIVTKVNGTDAAYMQKLNNGDVIEIYWEEN